MQAVTAEIMAEIDRRAQEEYGIPSFVLMENAGRVVAGTIISEGTLDKEDCIIVLCGKGNNGGDGFVAGRYLYAAGFKNIEIFASPEKGIKEGPAKDNYQKIKELGIKLQPLSSFVQNDLKADRTIIVDALFGTGFNGELKSADVLLCEKANLSDSTVYAIDIPSGLNATTGIASKWCIRANKTITFGLPKKGFYSGDGPMVCGEIIVDDIGFPEELLGEYL